MNAATNFDTSLSSSRSKLHHSPVNKKERGVFRAQAAVTPDDQTDALSLNRRKSHERGVRAVGNQLQFKVLKSLWDPSPAVGKEQASDYCDKLLSNLERYRNAQSRTRKL